MSRPQQLVVFSHLRWDWVWQRPQHLLSRIGTGRRTQFLELPVRSDVTEPVIHTLDAGPVTRVWAEVPHDWTDSEFSGATAEVYEQWLHAHLETGADLVVWLYAPTAIALAESLQPCVLVYDVMDDLANFAHAPSEMVLRMRRALDVSDVVFAGGRSLHRAAAAGRGSKPTHLFPSGVEYQHYAGARDLRRERQSASGPSGRRTAGYVGVLDERLDLALVGELARLLPDWDLHMVGPVTKIDPATLPQADNLIYPGMQAYADLPHVMAGFDVALMPFALNAATQSISPTKTLEYLAAGLPVVSTRVPDVVTDWGTVVHLADDAAEFAEACCAVVRHSLHSRDARVAPLRARHEWDSIAAQMNALLEERLQAQPVTGYREGIA